VVNTSRVCNRALSRRHPPRARSRLRRRCLRGDDRRLSLRLHRNRSNSGLRVAVPGSVGSGKI
jgi:hypothetical protein